MAAVEEAGTYVGRPVLRREDERLVTGKGTFVEGIAVPGMVWLAVVRSPFAHARVQRVDLSKALAAEGVVAAFFRRGPRRRVGGRAALRVAGDRGHEDPRPLPAHDR